uniref:Putative secreted peptide n=1 Tax=Anopheles braziliensis TaxID=58242 RepID=A0A2M3ZMW5_9DIPT
MAAFHSLFALFRFLLIFLALSVPIMQLSFSCSNVCLKICIYPVYELRESVPPFPAYFFETDPALTRFPPRHRFTQESYR